MLALLQQELTHQLLHGQPFSLCKILLLCYKPKFLGKTRRGKTINLNSLSGIEFHLWRIHAFTSHQGVEK
ncbi:unnamed protein product [Prunus brigantina]